MPIETLIQAIKHWSLGVFSSKDATRQAQATAGAAQASADLAYEVAESARATAGAAQSTADAALPYADAYVTHQAVYEWDGSTDDRDTFVHNGADYYKISDDVFMFDSVTAAASTRNDTGATLDDLYNGVNCFMAAGAIVVMQPGTCKLAMTQGGSYLQEFTAPSAGVYLYKYSDANYARGLTLDYKTATFARSSDLTSLSTRVDALEGAGGGGTGAFVVKFTATSSGTVTADKTQDEIWDALNAGAHVVGLMEEGSGSGFTRTFLNVGMQMAANGLIIFSAVVPMINLNSAVAIMEITIDTNDVVTMSGSQLELKAMS